ncbi:hypothetical protein PF005_g15134 [Phytophthora fragariae]|nr:hypothetical protein PF003_g38215 [Phytophthora fragariae]KAE9100855.1 hypothetical protein PF010_g14658 [Phytophthora fragariae]KAE9200989.1 hypothetical protein PF005_g15134 [Phytophthora fragariae]
MMLRPVAAVACGVESEKTPKSAYQEFFSSKDAYRVKTRIPDSDSILCPWGHFKQQVLYYKESEQAIRHLKKCAPFQELRHQFAFVYPFSDVLPLYNQKIYAKDTQQARQDGPDPR